MVSNIKKERKMDPRMFCSVNQRIGHSFPYQLSLYWLCGNFWLWKNFCRTHKIPFDRSLTVDLSKVPSCPEKGPTSANCLMEKKWKNLVF